MRDRFKIEQDRKLTTSEKQTEILLDIREILNGKKVEKKVPFGGPH